MLMNESFDHPEPNASALPARPEPIQGPGPWNDRGRHNGGPDLKRNGTSPSDRFNVWWSLGGAVCRRWYLLVVAGLGASDYIPTSFKGDTLPSAAVALLVPGVLMLSAFYMAFRFLKFAVTGKK